MTHHKLQYQQTRQTKHFSLTKRTFCFLEMICISVHTQQPVLLLGETDVGKDSCVQFLAENLSQLESSKRL
ncbi:unnamed protein product [Allacma fusca]|uniref:Midasin n=1 Tax=Allacma fusca TaxID=39272 RepID=A0A8J2JNT3_9HEXA|nr:unnamed protein product [Allacma fusca]